MNTDIIFIDCCFLFLLFLTLLYKSGINSNTLRLSLFCYKGDTAQTDKTFADQSVLWLLSARMHLDWIGHQQSIHPSTQCLLG
ncbi:hypothetical protein EXN66_Car006297 [Channa argus]|uniref:Uncharacterized protein n=1 Tax=Channa argus TaxID=215402 RepID=A0A6G1PKF9_CHAAH|nr:hypothetical protein EXN66_Car006297 [Channa argus]